MTAIKWSSTKKAKKEAPSYTVAVRDLHGSPPVPLGEGMAGGFSPDGKWVAATVNYTQLVLLPTGAGTSRRLNQGGLQQYGHPVLWLPDGKRLVFSGKLPGHETQCFVQNIDGGNPRAVTPEGVTWCRPSPDGLSVAARNIADGTGLIYPLNGGAPHVIPGLSAGENFDWSSDPKFLYVNQELQLPIKVYRLNVATGQRQLFKELNPTDATGLCGMGHLLFSDDGRSYVYGYTRLLSDLYLVKGLR